MLIQCTQKLLKEINKQPVQIEEKETFSWHANLTTINRQKAIVLINDVSRFVITVYGIKSIHKNVINDIITNAIKEAFIAIGIKESVLEKYINTSPEIVFTKTKDRAHVGRMNDVVNTIDFFDEYVIKDSLQQPALNNAINLHIFKNLDNKYIYPLDELYQMMDDFSGECSSACKGILLRVNLKLAPETPVWRKIIVPYDITFENLHKTIQSAFSWKNYHLFRFEVMKGETVIAESSDQYEFRLKTPQIIPQLKLNDQLSTYIKSASKIIYTYDFGDNWQHDIFIESIVEHNRPYPLCSDGSGITPPEDTGGAQAYQDIMDILKDKTHPEYKETKEWAHANFHYDFNILSVNSDIRRKYLIKDTSA